MQKVKLLLILFLGVSFYCYEFFLRILTGAYQEQIVEHFNLTTHISFSFLVSSYNITYLLMQIPAGMLLDRYGSKKVLIGATLLCGIGNIVFILGGYELALFGRLLVGLGSSFAFIGVLKLTLENFETKYFPIITSLVISLGTLAAAFSQNISVIISHYDTSWINIFIYSGIAAIPLAILFQLIIPSDTESSNLMPKFSEIIKRSKEILKNSLIWKNAIWAGLLYTPTVVLTSQYGVLFFKESYGFDTIFSTTMITAIFIGWIIFSPIMTHLCNKIDGRKIISISIIGIMLVSILICSQYMKSSALMLAFLFGVFSASQVLVWYYFNKICPAKFAAVGIAITNMLITLVIELGQLGAGLSIDSGDHFGIQASTSITIAFIIVLIFAYVIMRSMAKKLTEN
ncbi:MFS transporter [Candidatus Francisella endociliophora]|uniref:Lysosomal dipeptide transporter MFSD1 n=1 Tax=Candidatus Francisella endociliophora TaxID=653937 RepID=A0A097EPD5_9GAMM|nr:MFS transporter [Francisella sp. FSC1006]AIT09424.1 MFS transporter [Francisella sp. FSC1006]